jgi:hypothetical protein
MTITGFMLWNPIATTELLPGSIIPAALAAHGGEALLAVLAIVIWHMYNVHIKSFNPSMFTGWLPRDQMERSTLELERLELAGRRGRSSSCRAGAAAAELCHRQRHCRQPCPGSVDLALYF